MFTGIVQAVGQITHVTPLADDIELLVQSGTLDLTDVAIGDSIAVNGVCLTVIEHNTSVFKVHVSRETLSCTVGLDGEHPVNLEKALRLSDRLGGHLVSGHVDGIGQVINLQEIGDCWQLSIRAPHAIAGYIAVKGSITVDGVSLTVNTVDNDIFSVNLIPHTLEVTTLNHLGIGSRVNLEVDLIARYVERMASWQQDNSDDLA